MSEFTERETGDTTYLDFPFALYAALGGRRIAREGWNNKNQWVCYMPPTVIPSGMVNGRTRVFIPSGDLNVGGYFVILTAQGTWQPGWVPSQADMLAKDWVAIYDDQ